MREKLRPQHLYSQPFDSISDFCDHAESEPCVKHGCSEPAKILGRCKQHFIEFERFAEALDSVPPLLYAVATTDGSAVKFGISEDPERRFSGISTGSPVDLELVGYVAASDRLEKAVHQLLADYRIRGEWFRREGPAKDLCDILGRYNLAAFEEWMDKVCSE